MTDARNFLLDTDYPLDKIVYMTSGSISVPNTTNDLGPGVTFDHGLPFTPLPILIWSNSADFAVCNEYQDTDRIAAALASTSGGQSYRTGANSTQIGIWRYNFSGSAKTVYYKLFCFAPSNADAVSVVAATQNTSDDFILNTDYNYMKLAYSGILEDGVTESFDHNLGYVPRVQLWTENSGVVFREVESIILESDPTGSGGASNGPHITDTALIWMNPVYEKLHYRIYADA